jgi:methanethiol S-methyltransferase
MGRFLAVLYGAASYLLFLAVFAYTALFLGDLAVPRTIDGGPLALSLPPALAGFLSAIVGPAGRDEGRMPALAIDVALLGVFAVQHSVMARPAFKRVWTRIIPVAAERSTYVLLATLALLLICCQWRPLTASIWSVQAPWAVALLWALYAVGWITVVGSTFMIDHFHLFGLKQALGQKDGGAFKTPFLYRIVRHPIYFGFIIALWAAPAMSLGRLVFALGGTGYIIIGAMLEERDLIAVFGERYRQYRRQVAMLIPYGPK